MNAFERTNEVAHIRPQPFSGVTVDFTKAVAANAHWHYLEHTEAIRTWLNQRGT